MEPRMRNTLNKMAGGRPPVQKPTGTNSGGNNSGRPPVGGKPPSRPERPSPPIHTVVAGDTMWDIAQANNMPLQRLIRLNPHIADPNLIYVGDNIRLGRRIEGGRPGAGGADGRPPVQKPGQNAPLPAQGGRPPVDGKDVNKSLPISPSLPLQAMRQGVLGRMSGRTTNGTGVPQDTSGSSNNGSADRGPLGGTLDLSDLDLKESDLNAGGYDMAQLMQDPEFAAFVASYNYNVQAARSTLLSQRNILRRQLREGKLDTNLAKKDTVEDINTDYGDRGMFFGSGRHRDATDAVGDLERDYLARERQIVDQWNGTFRAGLMDLNAQKMALIAAAQQAAQRLTEQSIETAAAQAGLV